MKRIWLRKRLIPAVAVCLACLLLWTYIAVKKDDDSANEGNISLELIPDYKISTTVDMELWPRNTVLNQGMAAYFYVAGPLVHVNPLIQLKGATKARIDGSIKTSIVLRAVDDRSQLYWSYVIEEGKKENFSLNGEADNSRLLSYRAQQLVMEPVAASELAARINDELMLRAGINQLLMVADIELAGEIDGKAVSYSFKQELPLTLLQDSFTVPKAIDLASELAINLDTKAAEGPVFLNWIRQHSILFAADAALALLLLILTVTSSISKTRMEVERRRFKEWITEGSIQLQDRLPVKIYSLQGLVDLAIDLDKRVIFDPAVNKYFILDENIAYIYDPEQAGSMIENRTKLGKLLLERGLLQPEELELGLNYQKLTGKRLGDCLTALGLIDEATLYSVLAAQQNINYYELDPEHEFNELDWQKNMSLAKARALISLPLGRNSEGRLVVACAEPANEGVKNALRNLLGEDIFIVASKPSAVLSVLDRIEKQQRLDKDQLPKDGKEEKLSLAEKKQFVRAYAHGRLMHELLLKEAGISDGDNRELTSLIGGIEKALEGMSSSERQEGRLPGLTDVLAAANYINSDTAAWLTGESIRRGISVKEMLIKNYLASERTIWAIEQLLLAIHEIIS